MIFFVVQIGGVVHGVEHVEHPRLPRVVTRHIIEQAIVLGPPADDRATEIEDGLVQQPLFHQEQQIENAPGPAVAVRERMDRLELIVADGHSNQRVEVRIVVKEALPVGKQVAEPVLSLGRGVDHLASRLILQRGARHLPNVDRNPRTETGALRSTISLYRRSVRQMSTAIPVLRNESYESTP